MAPVYLLAAAGGIFLGGLPGVLFAWRHWRARLKLLGRTVPPETRAAVSPAPRWRDAWRPGR